MHYERKSLAPEQVERLAASEAVRYVGERTIILALTFRRRLYEAWVREPGVATVRAGLLEAGIDEGELGFGLAHEVERGFRRYGMPKRSCAPSPGDETVLAGAGLEADARAAADANADVTCDANVDVTCDANSDADADADAITDAGVDADAITDAGVDAAASQGVGDGGRRGACRRKPLTPDQVAALAACEAVRYVGERTLVLTLAARRRLYGAWERDRSAGALVAALAEAGIDDADVAPRLADDLAGAFARHGMPRRSNAPSASDPTVVPGAGLALEGGSAGYEARRALLASGSFVLAGGRLWPSSALEDALFAAWPGAPVADGLAEAGYDERLARAGLAARLSERFAAAASRGTSPAESRREGASPSPEDVGALLASPLVESASAAGVVPSAALAASCAALLGAGVALDDALDAHLVGHRLLSVAEKDALAAAAAASGGGLPDLGGTALEAEVLRRRADLLRGAVEGALAEAAPLVPSLTPLGRKALCLWVSGLPRDPAGELTVRGALALLGISKSSYYRHVGDESWGTSELARASRDAEDAAHVLEAFLHRGFRKGARQVCMLIPRLGHRRVGLRRVRRLMREQGLESGVRAPSPARRASAAFEAEAVAPDLLRRRFRLHRPNEVRVTDVTTLDHGDGLRAYGSALMDPVTSVLVAFVVSDRNDLDLALETLREGDSRPCADGGILHSDQGVLYKAGEFRAEVLGRGLGRSMSKRGNCWDNAVVESFFGHFKDECDYGPCATLDELLDLVADYADYHNRERGMWGRMRMTPVEYEAWLSGLGEEEFAAYLEREEAEWEAMRERAAELARRRYGTLGAS